MMLKLKYNMIQQTNEQNLYELNPLIDLTPSFSTLKTVSGFFLFWDSFPVDVTGFNIGDIIDT